MWLLHEERELNHVLLFHSPPPPNLQVTKNAHEQCEEKCAAFRYEYGIRFTPEQTIFVDESSFDRCTGVRKRGWAMCGQRLPRSVFFIRGTRCAVPASILLSELYASLLALYQCSIYMPVPTTHSSLTKLRPKSLNKDEQC